MMRKLVFMVLIGLFSYQMAFAENSPIPASAQSFVEHKWPKSRIDVSSIGDLDGDGINDFAAVITFPGESNDSEEVVVLHGDKTETFSLWANSNKFDEPRKGAPDMEIKKQSLFIYAIDATCCVSNFMHFQYKYRDGKFLLIGFESGETDTEKDHYEANVGLNLVTGDRVESRRVGKKSKRITSKITTRPLMDLKDFDASITDALYDDTDYLIDQHLNVRASDGR